MVVAVAAVGEDQAAVLPSQALQRRAPPAALLTIAIPMQTQRSTWRYSNGQSHPLYRVRRGWSIRIHPWDHPLIFDHRPGRDWRWECESWERTVEGWDAKAEIGCRDAVERDGDFLAGRVDAARAGERQRTGERRGAGL